MDNEVKLYLGDCLEILPTLATDSVDAVVTDPPYPDYHADLYKQTPIDFLNGFDCRQLIFWSAKADYPLTYSAVHTWDKMLGIMPNELIYERNGDNKNHFYRKCAINSTYAAMRARDVYTGHPSQKPIQLLRMLIEQFVNPGDTILDPFMGSGTTGVACVQTGRNFIGIEIEPKYFEIAEKRIKEAQMQLRLGI